MQITKQNNQIKFDRISHAYIADEALTDTLSMAVVCSDRVGKRPCMECMHCSKAKRGIHFDITTVSIAEGKRDILVDQVRDLKRDVYILPGEALQKAYVIRGAETMNHSAQNALLRVLEEPPAHAVFILCTNNPSALLPTIRSRSVILNHNDFPEHPNNSENEDEERLAQEFIEALGRDNVALMRCVFQIEKLNRITLPIFLTQVREEISTTFRKNTTYSEINQYNEKNLSSELLAKTEELLTKAEEMLSLNVNAGHIADMICAGLLGKEA